MEICTTTLLWIDPRLYRQKIYTDYIYIYIYIIGIPFSFGCQDGTAWINENTIKRCPCHLVYNFLYQINKMMNKKDP